MNRITLSTLKIILLVAIILSPIFVLAKSKAYLGVSCIDIQLDTVNRLRLKNSEGVLIVNVVDSSPADVSGLKVDDVIVQMDRTRIKTMDDFIKAAGSYKANKKAKISFIRKGETKIIPITFAERPKQIEPTDLSYDSAKENQINQLLDYVDKHNTSMGSLAIAKEKDILYSRAIGYKQIGEPTSLLADAETKYRVGSISKTFTSVMIHQLIEEGKLSSDTKLDSFFPAIPNSGKITIRMMLTHRSGIGSFTDAKDYLGWNLVARSQKEVIQKILDQKPVFKPGKKTAYSNSNYLLLGYIIEAIDKTAYSESLAKRITQKIGLSHTYYGGKIDVANNEALSYYNTGEWVLNPETDMSVPGGAGAIVSSASDLVMFIQALFKGELISAKSLEQMLKEKDGMSSGIYQITIGTKTYIGHGGRIDSFNSLVIYSPADKHALAYLENGNADPKLSIIALVTGIMSNQHINLPKYQESIQNPELDSYLGTYSNSDIPMTISLMKMEDELYSQAEGQEKVKLQAIAMDTFQCNALDLKIVFSLDKKSFTMYQRGQTLQFVKKD